MHSDRFAISAVVILLGITSILGLGLMGLLSLNDKDIPDAILATTSGASGGLAALLASVRQPVVPAPRPEPESFEGGLG